MTVFTQKMETEVALLGCDLCGTEQNKYHDPPMEERVYTETVAGSHGHDYLRDVKYHLCPSCRSRVGMMVQALRRKRIDGEVGLFKQLFKILDDLLDDP
jgi:hypothetical protein